MLSDEQIEVDDRPILRRHWRSWGCSLVLTGVLSLCAVATGALAQEAPDARAMGRAGRDGSRLSCSPILGDQERRVSAIYLDLDIQLPSERVGDIQLPHGRNSFIELSPKRIQKQQWFGVDSDLLDVGCSLVPGALTLILESASGEGCEIALSRRDDGPLEPVVFASDETGFGIDLISLDPSALTLILESASGEILEIQLTTLDNGPLEPTAFASDGAGFFINLIEWGGDGELVALDADFEVDLWDGHSVSGRVLWNAPWTPDEDPFVPLSDDDWKNAWPGEASIEGPALSLLFGTGWVEEWLASSPTTGLAGACSVAVPRAGSRNSAGQDRERMDSIRFLRESTQHGSPNSPGQDRERMDSIRFSRESTQHPKAARTEVAEDVASLSDEGPAAPTSAVSARSSAWLANPAQPTPTEEPARVSASQRRGAQICSRGTSAPRWQSGASQDPSSGCVSEVIRSEGAAGLEGSDQTEARVERGATDWAAAARSIPVSGDHAQRGAPIDAAGSGSASEIDPTLALQAQDQADAVGRGSQVADPASLESLIEECWLALRKIAARWLHAMNGYMMETYP